MNPTISPSAPGVRLDMTGRTALITGGSRGLGLAIGKRFLEAGAAVILVARRGDVLAASRDELLKLGLDRVTVHAGDMGDRDSVDALCATLNNRPIDVLVNNAGTSNRGPFEEQSDAIWQSDIDLKLFAAIRLSRFVLPSMRTRRWGRILNVVSINGKTPGGGGAPTSVTRAAGIALTKVLANEYGKHNILINALCTGVIESDQVANRHADSDRGLTLEEHMREEAKPIPLGRLGTAQEYANVALFLASDAGSYITGTAINIDGGLCRVV